MDKHELTYPDIDSIEYYRTRYHYLLQIIFGETIAIDYCKTIATFAPTEHARTFLLKQQLEEETHLELLTEYVGTHPRPHVLISKSLRKLDAIMVDAIERKDYVACIFVQHFIVEGLNISLLQELEHHADGALSELSTRILIDERRHMEFGVEEIKRMLGEDKSPALRRKLIQLQRKTLYYAIGLAITLSKESRNLGIPIKEFFGNTIEGHTERISRVGLRLPFVDTVFLKVARLLF